MTKKINDISNYIAYFIDFSIQEIPHITYIAEEIGGTVFTNSKITERLIKRDFPSIEVKYHKSIESIKSDITDLNKKIVIYPDYHLRYFKDIQGLKHVQVFHGISDKSYDYNRELLKYDLFFIAGEYFYKKYEKKGLLKKNTGKLIGYPKFDRVFKGEINKKKIMEKLSIKDNRPIVLYAPTWIDKALNSSWKKFYRYILYDKPEWLYLIIKPHPNLIRYREEEVKECVEFSKVKDSIKIIDDMYDITPVLAISDILIGDVSSVTREFLAFKKPFVFLSNKPKWMWKRDKIRLWDCGEVVTDPRIIWHTVEKSLENPDKFREKIDLHFKETFYKPDGNAAERAGKEIIKLL